MNQLRTIAVMLIIFTTLSMTVVKADHFEAGVSKVEITDREAGPVNDPLYVKALVIKSSEVSLVVITVDAVAIGEIGRISNDYLPKVRSELSERLGIDPKNVMVNASHCHGVVRRDIACLLYTSPSPRDGLLSRMPSSA